MSDKDFERQFPWWARILGWLGEHIFGNDGGPDDEART